MGERAEDADHPERDAAWDGRARHETTTKRLDRNWADLLQELRVVQTGVQLLTGFLLTLPFQAFFTTLSAFEENVYLFTVACSVLATGLAIAPVSLHRILFRQRARRLTVSIRIRGFRSAGRSSMSSAQHSPDSINTSARSRAGSVGSAG
jgi:hypothetical protein